MSLMLLPFLVISNEARDLGFSSRNGEQIPRRAAPLE
jgi:hypothetical protein